jgi:hypothetical protein
MYEFYIMNPIIVPKPKHAQNHQIASPGVVGSVGDVNLTPRLKHSAPEMPIRWDPYFAGYNEIFLGSNVQNGDSESYCSGGKYARTIDSNWGGRRSFNTSRGWVYQDMRAPDKEHEPMTGSTPQYSWNNRIATTYEAKVTGDRFLPLPGTYIRHPSQVARGGMVPRIVDDEAQEQDADLNPIVADEMPMTRYSYNPLRGRRVK